MMRLIDLASTRSDELFLLMTVVALKSALILAVAGITALLLRRASASSRHVVWSLAFLGCILLPCLCFSLPGVAISLRSHIVAPVTEPAPIPPDDPEEPVLVASAPDRRSNSGLAFFTTPLVESSEDPTSLAHQETEPALDSQEMLIFSIAAIGIGIWSLGVFVATMPVLLGLIRLRRLRLDSELVTDPATLELARAIASRMGLTRRVTLLRSRDRAIPMTWGIVRTFVLLPSDSADWTLERLGVALGHELAHVKRFDCLTQLMARCVCAFHWFNPLAWLALSRLRAEQEQACDDLAITDGTSPPAYAAHLLAIVSGRATERSLAVVARTMASVKRLERRLVGILDPSLDRRPIGPRRTGVFGMVAAGLIATVAVVGFKTVEAEPAARAPGEAPPSKPSGQAEVLEAVRDIYIKPPDAKVLEAGAIKGMIEALDDPHSNFVDSRQLALLETQLEGKIAGIGAQLETKDGKISVIAPLPDSPAFKAGLESGDVILEVDGKTTTGVALAEVVKRIVGPVGTVVRLSILRADGRTESLEITRGLVAFSSLLGFGKDADGRPLYQLDPEHGIAYVRLYQFSKGTTSDLTKVIEGLQAKGLKGLVLDLRACPGGLMSEAVDTARLFLTKGKIVTLKGRDRPETVFSADGPGKFAELPLVILVNEQTASAAEIVSGSLKDNDRAKVVGTRTFGKGSVQTIIKLKDGSGALRLTTAYYELPSGRNIDRVENRENWGVDPTDGYVIPIDPAQAFAMSKKQNAREKPGAPAPAGGVTPATLETDEADPQLAGALKTLLAKTTNGDFIKVGESNANFTSKTKRLDDIRKRRAALLKDLGEIDREIGEMSLQKPSSNEQ